MMTASDDEEAGHLSTNQRRPADEEEAGHLSTNQRRPAVFPGAVATGARWVYLPTKTPTGAQSFGAKQFLYVPVRRASSSLVDGSQRRLVRPAR
jgi:hypothetical protein